METLIDNVECTYIYKIDVLNERYYELLEIKDDLEEDLKDLIDNEKLNPYYFEKEFILIKTQLEIINQSLHSIQEHIKNLKYEVCN
jgi:hypothetical protein